MNIIMGNIMVIKIDVVARQCGRLLGEGTGDKIMANRFTFVFCYTRKYIYIYRVSLNS